MRPNLVFGTEVFLRADPSFGFVRYLLVIGRTHLKFLLFNEFSADALQESLGHILEENQAYAFRLNLKEPTRNQIHWRNYFKE
jgi:hypothetical protein